MLPISIHATKIGIRNWERIQGGNANSLLETSHFNAEEENLPWATNVRDIFAKNGLLELYLTKTDGTQSRKLGKNPWQIHFSKD